MPTIKMVARSTTTCKKVERYRHVLQKSYKRSRRSGTMVKVGDVKENLDVASQTIVNGGVIVNNESPKEHDNEEHPLTIDLGKIDWQSFASFNGCADSIVQTGFFPFSVYGSTDSDSNILLSYYHRADDAQYNLFEAVNQEQIAIAPQVNANTIPNFQTPDMLHSYVNQAYPGDFSSDEFVFDDSFDYSTLFDDLDFSGTDLLYDLTTFEETIPAPNYHYAGSCEQLPEQMPDSSWFDSVCHQAKPHPEEIEAVSSQFDSERVDYTDQEAFIKNFLEISDEPGSLPALISDEPRKTKNTLVLDMDETLIHSTMGQYDSGADFTIQILLNNKEYPVYVRKRPYLHEFLERVSKMFEIIVFTASKQLYAEKLLDVLDPDNKLFSRRVYRDSCIYLDGCYTKDLTVLGIDLAKVAIVDNCPQVFRLQVNNGIPIQSWFDDPSDSALISLLPFLEKLVDADDVRPIIAEKFGNKKD